MDLEKHEELLKEVQKQYPDIILDGAVNNDCWSKDKIRILWVVKEVTEFPKGNDLRNLLRQLANDPEPNKIYSNWESAYELPIRIAYEFMKPKKRITSLTDKRAILNQIAVIAVNKCIGVNRSSHGEMSKAAEKFREITLRQINLLDPTVVISVGAFHYLFERGKA